MARCRYGEILTHTDVPEGLSSRLVRAYLSEQGFKVGKSAVNLHRAKECVCYRHGAKLAPAAKNLKILVLDIENSPNVAHVWSLFKQNVSLAQLQETASTISFAAKWYHEDEVHFYSDFHHGHEEMIRKAYEMVSEADLCVHFNGTAFDMKHLNREFLLAGFPPPATYRNVDLLTVVRKHFKFASNKLQHVSQQLGIGSKVSHEGHELWVRCMAGDPDAWETMRVYNIGDILLTQKLYDRLRPWLSNHPHIGQYTGIDSSCPACGSNKLTREGTAYANATRYRQYRCECGALVRGTAKLGDATRTRSAVAA